MSKRTADSVSGWAVGELGVIRFYNGVCWQDVQAENIQGSLHGIWGVGNRRDAA